MGELRTPDQSGAEIRDSRVPASGEGVTESLSQETGSLPDAHPHRATSGSADSGTSRILDVEARELQKGDDLFGAGVLTSAVWVGGSIRVEYGAGAGATFWPDEVVTVRRG